MARFFFTFDGSTPYGKCFVEIEAETKKIAREVMQDAHGQRWAFCYSEAEFSGQPERYDLQRLSLIEKNEFGNWRPVHADGGWERMMMTRLRQQRERRVQDEAGLDRLFD